jgi:hypothetical protein
MASERLNPDQINWSSAIKEMRDEGMDDDAIHKEIAGEFGSTVADQHLKRGKFAPVDNAEKAVAPVWGEGWDKVENKLPWEIPVATAAGGAAVHFGKKVHDSLRGLMASKSNEGLLATQQAEKAVAQQLAPQPAPAEPVSIAEATPKQLSALDMPTTGTAPETNIGKPLPKSDVELVEKGVGNTARKAAAAEVAAAQNAPEGWKPNYLKNKANPIGPGAFNYLASQVGPEEAAKIWEEQYGKKNVPYAQFEKDWSAAKRPSQPVPEGSKPGGSFGKPAHVPEYIRGSISPAAAMNLGANALGAIGLQQAYAHGKKTGDWSDLGLGAIIQAISNIAPRVALPFALMSPSSVSSGTLDSPEGKELMERSKKKGIAPPSR